MECGELLHPLPEQYRRTLLALCTRQRFARGAFSSSTRGRPETALPPHPDAGAVAVQVG